MKPAEFIIKYFGGVRKTGRIVGRSAQAVSMWPKPKSIGGADGGIPRKVQVIIMKIAKKKQVAITPEILMFGGTAKQLEELTPFQ